MREECFVQCLRPAPLKQGLLVTLLYSSVKNPFRDVETRCKPVRGQNQYNLVMFSLDISLSTLPAYLFHLLSYFAKFKRFERNVKTWKGFLYCMSQ